MISTTSHTSDVRGNMVTKFGQWSENRDKDEMGWTAHTVCQD